MESDAKYVYKLHSDFLRVLAHPRRLEILDLLRSRERSFAELMRLTGMKKANLSQHLTMLRGKQIVGERRHVEGLMLFLARPQIMEAYDVIHALMAGVLNEQAAITLDPQTGSISD